MTDRVKFKAFPTAFKLAAIKRLEAGEAVLPLARKLGVSRKLLHVGRIADAIRVRGSLGAHRCSEFAEAAPQPSPREERGEGQVIDCRCYLNLNSSL
jgi:transposase